MRILVDTTKDEQQDVVEEDESIGDAKNMEIGCFHEVCNHVLYK
jgi:hypothetical protein